jgi:pyrroloquinoline quinone biosynthesis protein D
MKSASTIHWPILARRARYRRDSLRQQHQIVFPEGVLVLNETGAAIVQLCDGRSVDDVIAEVNCRFSDGDHAAEVIAFLDRLFGKGLLDDARVL